MARIKKAVAKIKKCKADGGKHYYKLSVGGKFAHDVTCKCKVHITDSDKAKGLTPQPSIRITCIKCGKVNQTTQRNTTNTTVWDTSDGHIIVSG
tara:strand:+ start:269 stop:550 length:282 start_codon:yes stop_codon:yes gene_type:complete